MSALQQPQRQKTRQHGAAASREVALPVGAAVTNTHEGPLIHARFGRLPAELAALEALLGCAAAALVRARSCKEKRGSRTRRCLRSASRHWPNRSVSPSPRRCSRWSARHRSKRRFASGVTGVTCGSIASTTRTICGSHSSSRGVSTVRRRGSRIAGRHSWTNGWFLGSSRHRFIADAASLAPTDRKVSSMPSDRQPTYWPVAVIRMGTAGLTPTELASW